MQLRAGPGRPEWGRGQRGRLENDGGDRLTGEHLRLRALPAAREGASVRRPLSVPVCFKFLSQRYMAPEVLTNKRKITLLL